MDDGAGLLEQPYDVRVLHGHAIGVADKPAVAHDSLDADVFLVQLVSVGRVPWARRAYLDGNGDAVQGPDQGSRCPVLFVQASCRFQGRVGEELDGKVQLRRQSQQDTYQTARAPRRVFTPTSCCPMAALLRKARVTASTVHRPAQ